jgi:dTDP-4-amino-4,6-dideoxygalactose transaminase
MHACAVSSGTAALDLLMHELGVGDGDVVIASSLTFVATVGPAYHRGAKIVFVDTDPITGTISIPLLRDALDSFPEAKCVIAADIYGQCSDYDSLEEVCSRADVTLVVDAAEAVGAKWKGRKAGNAGKCAIYSFNGNKIITTSGGGAVLSNDEGIVLRSRWRAQQSRENFVWYEHREIGFNYRMSNLLGALGCAQVDRLPEILRRKKRIFDFYSRELSDVTIYPCERESESSHWLSVFLYENQLKRDEAIKKLSDANIESRPVWKPLHLQDAFRGCDVFGGDVSKKLFENGLCLPSGAGLELGDLERVVETLS